MRKSIFSGLNQAHTPKLYISILSVIVLVYVGSTEALLRVIQQRSLLPAGYHKTFMNNAFESEAVISFLPVLAILPFSGTYVDDLKSKYARFYLIRVDYGCYLWSRIVVCFFSGGGAILLGSLLSWGISALLFMPMEIAVENRIISTVSICPKLVLFFLTGGLWAVVGMAMSTLMESKYIAYASPFVIYYLQVILCERYFPDAFLLYPPNWTNPEVWPYGAWGAAIFLIELTLVFSILFVIRAGRRLQEL